MEHADLKLEPLNIMAPGETSSMLRKESWYAGFNRAWKSEALEFVRVCVWAGEAPDEPLLKNDESPCERTCVVSLVVSKRWLFDVAQHE